MTAGTTLEVLRSLLPTRPLDLCQAIRIAELQADHLLGMHGLPGPPVPELIISAFPRVQVVRASLVGVAVTSQWAKGRWIIVLNRSDAPTRQRFSLAHEFKHILDRPTHDVLYPSVLGYAARSIAEQAANHFAASFLMPSRWLRESLAEGTEAPTLAEQFDVSVQAIQVRLSVLGLSRERALSEPLPTSPPRSRSRRATRDANDHWS